MSEKLAHLAISSDGFIFDPETGNSYTVNEVGLLIIEKLKSGKKPEEIVEEILQIYDVDRETVEKDLDEFLQQLRLFGFLGGTFD